MGLEVLGRSIVSRDEAVGSHLLSILGLTLSVRDGSDVGAHCLGKKQTKVTLFNSIEVSKGANTLSPSTHESSDSHNSNILGSRSGTILLQGRVHSSTAAKHGSSDSRVEAVGNFHNEMTG